MAEYVLDASATLAFLRDQPGAQAVEDALLKGCYISAVTWAQVSTALCQSGRSPEDIDRLVADDGPLSSPSGNLLEIIPFTREDALIATRLQPGTERLELADRACLALAERLKLPVLTDQPSKSSRSRLSLAGIQYE
jgi:ribonuclease VapC